MRLTPGQGIGLLAAALVLGVLAIAHAAAPPTCSDADKAFEGRRYTEAAKAVTNGAYLLFIVVAGVATLRCAVSLAFAVDTSASSGGGSAGGCGRGDPRRRRLRRVGRRSSAPPTVAYSFE